MRKSIIVVLTVFLVSIPAVGIAAFAGGDGSPATPYQITNCDQLQEVTNNLGANYALTNDVDCSDTVNWNFEGGVFKGFMPIGKNTDTIIFTGTFDGQGHRINGLFINRPSDDGVALFQVPYPGVVKNVGLVDVNMKGRYYVGAIAGINSGLITYSYATGTVTGGIDHVGGLVGSNSWAGSITNSYSAVDVKGRNYIGGLIGTNDGVTANSYAKGNVTGDPGSPDVGGLVASTYPGDIVTNSYWDTQTSGQSTSSGGTGKTTAEMMQQATYETWDFVDIWAINEGVSYPCLKWQITPEAAIASTNKIKAAITLLPDSALKNANNKKAVLNKLNDAIASIDAGYYTDALDLLKNGILGRTDGCATMGTPDKNDTLMTCSAQNQVYPLVQETIWIVEGVLAP